MVWKNNKRDAFVVDDVVPLPTKDPHCTFSPFPSKSLVREFKKRR